MTLTSTGRHVNPLMGLPFSVLNDDEFLKAPGSWINHCSSNLVSAKDLYKDVLESPDKCNDSDDNNIVGNYTESKYFSVKQTGLCFKIPDHKGFSILHSNIRSLSKNLTLLNDLLLSLAEIPSIIAISETKLNESSQANIDIPGYVFLGSNSKTAAGGVGFYIAKSIDFTRRPDLEMSPEGIESCWIEITREKQKNIIIGCVYRYPSNNREHFLETLQKNVTDLNSHGRGFHCR